VTDPTTGLSNPCLDIQHLLCLDNDCSRGGKFGTESHCAIYACTLRVSVTVLATVAVQSSDNGLPTWCITLRQWVDGGVIKEFTTGLIVTALTKLSNF
jgi:hypothetical protein